MERFNRTLKHRLWCYFTTSTKQNWADVLLDVVNSYSNSVHRTLGRKPTDITPAVVGDVREEVLFNHPLNKKIGDTIFIANVKSIFVKGYLLNWTEQTFTAAAINRKTSPVTYKLKGYNGEVTEGSLYL